jgi:hypothetical protein
MVVNGPVIRENENKSILCPVCGCSLAFQITRGRKSGKPSLMLKCPRDGRHFRGFICDQNYLQQLLERLEQAQKLINQT